MELSSEQQLAFDKYKQGHNLFITGPGGSGKSELIRKIYGHAISKFKYIHVCALTGCAALLLNCKAKTLHSWAGIGLGNAPVEALIQKIRNNKYARAIWRDTEVLIIDEVSMLSLKLFNLLNQIGKAIRENTKPFGGIQIIFSGDFYQLPPVGSKDDPDSLKFCFESEDWDIIFSHDCQIQLLKIFRQKDDNYSNILNQIRIGKIKRKSYDLLMKYVGREYDVNLITEPTKLFPTRNKVDNINNSKMAELDNISNKYEIKYITDAKITQDERNMRFRFSELEISTELEILAGNLLCEKIMNIKVGCQVMSVVNIKSEIDDSLEICNGSQGKVIDICKITGFPIVKFNNGLIKVMGRHVWLSEKIPGIGISQIPLILAWALTIHKSQGSTMDVAEIDIGSGIFECGQSYVALSRVKSLNGLYLTSFDVKKIKINNKVKEFYDKLTEKQNQNEIVNASATINTNISIATAIAEPIQVFETIANTIALALAVAEPISQSDNPFSNYNHKDPVAIAINMKQEK